VITNNGEEIFANKSVFSGATPDVTFGKLFPNSEAYSIFGSKFMNSVNAIDYTSPVTKINGELIGFKKNY